MRTKKWFAALLAVVMVIAMLPAAAFAAGTEESGSLVSAQLPAVSDWTKDRAEPASWEETGADGAAGSGYITTAVTEQQASNSWYDWQGRSAVTKADFTNYWVVETQLVVTDAMMQTNTDNAAENQGIRSSLWIKVDGDTTNGDANLDWSILQFCNNGSNVTWQWWDGQDTGNWVDISGVTPVAGTHSLKTVFDNGTIYQYIDGTQVNQYELGDSYGYGEISAPSGVIIQNRTLGESYATTWKIPSVQYAEGYDYDTIFVGGEDSNYSDLATAVAAADNGATVVLGKDVTLTSPVEVAAGADIVIDGNGHTVTLGYAGAAFNNSTSVEGLKAGTNLTVNGVDFVGHTEGQADHAVIVGAQGDVNVTLSGCSFTNMYDAVYCNQVTDSAAKESTITIEYCDFSNVAYYYGVDDGATTGGRTDMHTFVLTDNTGDQLTAETFAVATVNGVGYTDLSAAVAAAGEGDTVTLLKDVALDSKLDLNVKDLVLDLNNHEITASEQFVYNQSNPNGCHLVDVLADGVTIENGSLVATDGNKHTLNIYNANGVVLNNLTVDHTNGVTGAPIVINNASVTVKGDLNLVVGEHSWYGINVDPKNGQASLVFADGSHVSMTGNDKLPVIKLDGEQSDITISGTQGAGLDDNGNGIYGLHTHVFDGEWSYDENGHWQTCVCGETSTPAAHTYGDWIVDKAATATEAGSQHHVCTVCGYEESQVIPATGETGGNTGDSGNTGNTGDNTGSSTGDNTGNGNTSSSTSNTNNATSNNTNSSTNNGPKTGDNSNITFVVGALLIACCVVVGILVYNSKIKAAYHGKHSDR